jgi:hypothetical protein
MANVIGDIKDKRGGAILASGVVANIMGPFDLLRYPHKAFTVWNGSSVTLSGALLQANPDQGGYESGVPLSNPGVTGDPPNAGLWENFDTTSFNSLASGAVKTVFVNGSVARWWQIVGLSNQTPNIMASGWVYGNAI